MSAYTIKEIDDKENWHSLLKGFKDANIYQVWEYSTIVQGEKNVEHVIIEYNDEIIGLAQVRIKIIPILNRGIAYIFAGPLWQRIGHSSNKDNLKIILIALSNEYAYKRNLLLRIRPFLLNEQYIDAKLFYDLSFEHSKKSRIYRTLMLDLNKSLEEIRKTFKPRWRRWLSKAEKSNLYVKKGTEIELFIKFKQIYNEMILRKKFKEYINITKFEKIQNELDEKFKMIIFLAYKDGIPLAGLIGSKIGTTGIYLFGASNEKGLEFNASYLLHWHMIQWLKQMGCLRYDLGGIDPIKNPGVYQFKSGITNLELHDLGTFDISKSILSKLLIRVSQIMLNKK